MHGVLRHDDDELDKTTVIFLGEHLIADLLPGFALGGVLEAFQNAKTIASGNNSTVGTTIRNKNSDDRSRFHSETDRCASVPRMLAKSVDVPMLLSIAGQNWAARIRDSWMSGDIKTDKCA